MFPESLPRIFVSVVCITMFAPDVKESPVEISISPTTPATAEPVRMDTSCTPDEDNVIPPLEPVALAPAVIVMAPPVSVSEFPEASIRSPALPVSEDPALNETSPPLPFSALPTCIEMPPLKPLVPYPVDICTPPELLPLVLVNDICPLDPVSLEPDFIRI